MLRERARALLAAEAPWVLTGEPAPETAAKAGARLARRLSEEARSPREQAGLDRALRELIDGWMARHPGNGPLLPPPVTIAPAPPPFWTPDRLEDLRRARAIQRTFEARVERYQAAETADEEIGVPPGLVLLSAIFDSGCLAADHLGTFAHWLREEGPLEHAEDLPPWVDLKERNPRIISGEDEKGPFALRRLFLATRTLDLIGACAPGDPASPAPALPDELLRACLAAVERTGDPPRSLRALLSGALALHALGDEPPDQATLQLAARRLQSFAFTPASWQAALGGAVLPSLPAAGEPAAEPPSDPIDRRALPGGAEGKRRTAFTAQGFALLQAAVHASGTARENLTTDEVKRTARAMARDLRQADGGGRWPDSLQLLRGWYLDLLEEQKLAPHSVQRYHSTVGAALCAGVGDLPLSGLGAADFEELYTSILEADNRSPRERLHLRHRLRLLHAFGRAAPAWGFPALEDEIFGGGGESPRIRAVALSQAQIRTARNLIRTGLGLAPDVAAAADAAFLLASRAGLRIGEVTKALITHLEQTDAGDREGVEPVLFILPSRFGDNKTRSAYRQIRPFVLMAEAEKAEFAAWLTRRRAMANTGPLFGVPDGDGEVAPFSRTALAEIFALALRRATGLDDPSAHSLRRHALNNLYLALGERRSPDSRRALVPDRLLTRLTGWNGEERRRAADAIAPPTLPRDTWAALARTAGHGAPLITFEAYIGLADLEVFRRLARPAPTEATECALRRLRHRVRALPAGPETVTAMRPIPSWGRPTPAVALKALQGIDRGLSLPQAAMIAQVDESDLEGLVAIARQWSALRTSRGRSRLQARGEEERLAPRPVGVARQARALGLAERLVMLGESDPEATPGPVANWLRVTLTGASQTNAGIRFRDPASLRRWLTVALQLRPASSWHMEVITRADATDEEIARWADLRPPEMPRSVRHVGSHETMETRLRLLSRTGRRDHELLDPVDSSAGALRFAAHLAAIALRVGPEAPDSAP